MHFNYALINKHFENIKKISVALLAVPYLHPIGDVPNSNITRDEGLALPNIIDVI